MAYGAAGGAALLAVAMLVWGRLVHRGFLILIAAGIGFVLAGWICPLIEVDVLVGGIVAALSLGLLAIVLARVVWAMLAATLLAAVAAGAVVAYYWPEVSTQPATPRPGGTGSARPGRPGRPCCWPPSASAG